MVGRFLLPRRQFSTSCRCLRRKGRSLLPTPVKHPVATQPFPKSLIRSRKSEYDVTSEDGVKVPHFRVGLKKQYFPRFRILFLRTPHLPPTQARFAVPLYMNKLDLRDYLWHGYNVRAFNIRVWVKQRPVQKFDPRRSRKQTRWFRRKSRKFMTVEMDEPFYWPEVPTDFKTWDKSVADEQRKESESMQDAQETKIPFDGGSDKMEHVVRDRDLLREQAERLRKGELRWEPTWKTLVRKGLKEPYVGWSTQTSVSERKSGVA